VADTEEGTMTDRDAGDKAMTNEQAAEIVRNDPALGADSPDPHADNVGTDDDATTPDRAVTEKD
jgi:hypothetical protein